MKEFEITKPEEGQKLIRFLQKILKEASLNFLYKMLRKKNITLNNKKADGSEVLHENDTVKIFFTDETFLKFSGSSDHKENEYEKINADGLDIIFEDDDLIFFNKPSGMLSQKSKDGDISANEILIAYMLKNNMINSSDLRLFKPSIINRIDRNTSGLILFGKTMKGLKTGQELVKGHKAHKTYRAIVKGRIDKEKKISGYLIKDKSKNLVKYSKTGMEGSVYMDEIVRPIISSDFSLIEIELLTGRSHQIRASLSFYGHPILGDPKYGDRELNNKLINQSIRSQLLHSYSIVYKGKIIKAREPQEFEKVMKWQHGILGDLEAQHSKT
jgi:23S rRNA pseudouridine955/2504/2580 synthase